MRDYSEIVTNLRRPRLLIQAARHGTADYSRQRDLGRLMHSAALPTPQQALDTLLADEERLELTRRSGGMSYSFGRHINVLAAILSELQLLRRSSAAGPG
ncbi:MAG: hypothetical protein RLZZ528_185 [Pseudomonadota bacterium]